MLILPFDFDVFWAETGPQHKNKPRAAPPVTNITDSSESSRQPLVWLLFGERRGDNAQVQALARMLGWPFQVKQLRWVPDYDIEPREAGISLAGLDRAASDPLEGPWPDIVVGIGYRSAPVSRWIQQQGGGKALNVRLGRPRTELSPYDLIITTPQYGLPAAANVRELPLPLVAIDEAQLAAARARWLPQLAALPHPRIAVLLGGPTQHMAFDDKVAAEIAAKLQAFAAKSGGALLITTSPRSPGNLPAILARSISAPHFLHAWKPDADNPYLALLAEADQVVVTGDSISMAADVAAFGKPLLIYELPWLGRSKKPGLVAGIKRAVRERRERRGMAGLPADPLDSFYDLLTRMGRARPRRNALEFNKRVYEAGIARPFDPGRVDTTWQPAPAARAAQDCVIAEIRALWRARQGS
jgi:mitochondrial fission protein ELM1